MNGSHRPLLRLVLLAVVIVFGATACSPADRSALTLDAASRLPALVLGLCNGEGVTEVTLAPIVTDGVIYDTRPPLWRIQARRAQVVRRFVVGQVPDGFTQTVALSDLLSERPMTGEFHLGARVRGGGAAAHGDTFSADELRPSVLLRYGEPISASDFAKSSRAACSGNLFDDFGLPPWIQWFVLAGFVSFGVVLAGFALRSRARVRRLRAAGVIK